MGPIAKFMITISVTGLKPSGPCQTSTPSFSLTHVAVFFHPLLVSQLLQTPSPPIQL